MKNINFNIDKNDKVAFVGPSGSGKTTLMDLLMGLLKPTEGKILVNGIDINSNQIITKEWMSYLSHSPQFNYIYYSTIYENITRQKMKNKINSKIGESSGYYLFQEYFRGNAQGLDTIVGEGGFKLSGGQQQRLGIARTLFKDKSIICLDEATSALDNKTSLRVINQILNHYEQKKIIVISHKTNFLVDFNKIILLDKGEIVSQGNFEELKNESELFRSLLSFE